MERVTVAESVRGLENLLQVLDNAYWEASQMAHKDTLYDTLNVVQGELNELAKLGAEDLGMVYEPVTVLFRTSVTKLKRLHNNIDTWVARSKTAEQLEIHLSAVINLLNHCSDR